MLLELAHLHSGYTGECWWHGPMSVLAHEGVGLRAIPSQWEEKEQEGEW